MREEIIVNKTTSKCFNITAGAIDSLRLNTNIETTVRVYDGEHIGVAGKVGSADLEALKQEARENLKLGISYPDTPSAPIVRKEDTFREIIPASQLVSTVKRLLARITAENPQFIFGNKIILKESENSYIASNGTELSYRGSALEISLTIKYKGSANIMDDGYGALLDTYDEDKVCAGVKAVCDAFLKRSALPEGDETLFITDTEFLSNILVHFAADYYCNHLSLFDGKLGEKIFSDRLSVALDGNPARTKNIPFFDAEGVIAEDDCVFLVKEGVFSGLLANKKQAAQYGVQALGTAGAYYDAVPVISGRGFTALPTAETLSELLGDREAIFVTTASGGDVTADGTLSTPVQTSYGWKNGALTGKLPEFALTGNVKELFGASFIGVAKNGPIAYNASPYLVFRAKMVNKQEG